MLKFKIQFGLFTLKLKMILFSIWQFGRKKITEIS